MNSAFPQELESCCFLKFLSKLLWYHYVHQLILGTVLLVSRLQSMSYKSRHRPHGLPYGWCGKLSNRKHMVWYQHVR